MQEISPEWPPRPGTSLRRSVLVTIGSVILVLAVYLLTRLLYQGLRDSDEESWGGLIQIVLWVCLVIPCAVFVAREWLRYAFPGFPRALSATMLIVSYLFPVFFTAICAYVAVDDGVERIHNETLEGVCALIGVAVAIVIYILVFLRIGRARPFARLVFLEAIASFSILIFAVFMGAAAIVAVILGAILIFVLAASCLRTRVVYRY